MKIYRSSGERNDIEKQIKQVRKMLELYEIPQFSKIIEKIRSEEIRNSLLMFR